MLIDQILNFQNVGGLAVTMCNTYRVTKAHSITLLLEAVRDNLSTSITVLTLVCYLSHTDIKH